MIEVLQELDRSKWTQEIRMTVRQIKPHGRLAYGRLGVVYSTSFWKDSQIVS